MGINENLLVHYVVHGPVKLFSRNESHHRDDKIMMAP